MGIDCDRITPFSFPLVGFAGEQVQPIGLISLPVTAGIAPKQKTVMVDFLVIDRLGAYNAIISRPALNWLKAVTSTYHLMMKFPTEEGVGEVKGDQTQARRCYNTSFKRVLDPTPIVIGTVGGNSRNEPKGEPAEPLEDVVVSGGIDPKDILHQLNVDPSVKPVKQKRRKFALERNMAIAEEVEKLFKARFIEEVYYLDCFMDAFSGYNQIYMHPEDREKTAFITD
ncbi:uncharacterized protein LOC132170668 [Corylus avellana]|uniref:uncharacterized protein LOC132170668 n=1 Tax=Corylus avellana TaxID=13451 RepID=UPI00286A5768|nr:uncharacterized protein LOC132170668 [Corylus avellana]